MTGRAAVPAARRRNENGRGRGKSPPPSARSIAVDLTTSRQYRGRPPVGIVRTEREIAKAFYRRSEEARFTFYDPEGKVFRLMSREEARDILYEAADDAELHTAPPDLAPADNYETIAWMPGELFVSGGLTWDNDFLELLYRAKLTHDLFVCQIVHDMNPVVMPEFCVPGMFERFPRFIVNVLWIADVIFGVSDNTNADLTAYANEIGAPLPRLERIFWGCDITNFELAEPPPRLQRLKPGHFVLYVSTIEPRKNHILIYHVWRRLVREHPDLAVPLVLIGGKGWNSADLLQMMGMDERLNPDYLVIEHGVSDAALDWLYRNCAFTVYPSLYEGWGLPVGESLARGRPCIASNTSSIPEASQGFAELIDPLDFPAWYAAVSRLLRQNARGEVDASRLADFNRLDWTACMERFCDRLAGLYAEARTVA